MKENLKAKKRSKVLLLFVIFVSLLDLFLQLYFSAVGFGVANRGVSFGLAQTLNWDIKYLLLVLMTGLFCFLFLSKRGLNLGLFTLFVGGVVNLLVRFYLGFVWDYLRLPWVVIWINLSDVLITIGALSYILVDDENRDSGGV